MSELYDVAILGAGASGLFSAGELRGLKVALIEGNEKAGKKLLASGGGRCNFTNARVTPSHFRGDGAFVGAILERFDHRALLAWLKGEGLAFIKVKNQQYFCAHHSRDLLAILEKRTRGVAWHLGQRIVSLTREKERFVVKLARGEIHAKSVLVATGGLSFPALGASGVGYEIARSFGHEVITPAPALVGFTLQPQESWLKALSGVSFPASLRVGERRLKGDLLLTHRGMSGPVVLDASLFWERGNLELTFVENPRRFLQGNRAFISSLLPLPKRLSKALLSALGIEDQPFDSLESTAQARLLEALESYRFAPAGNFGYTKAEVTRGGVSTREISPQSLESQRCEGLFFAGEVLDVTGQLGGYNLQWAFSSAKLAAQGVRHYLKGES